jgi:glycerol-3-phosphate O-acyltransferase
LPDVTPRPSPIFWIYLKFLSLFRSPYLWLEKKYPDFFARRLGTEVDLDTSRMLSRFNALHHWFFRRGFEKIGFDDEDLRCLKEARARGPVIFLMKNWGQVEYNFFNQLFLEKKLPLVAHNNLIKMGHWMPWRDFKPMRRQKIDRYMREGTWPDNYLIFDLAQTLRGDKPVLYCLDLPKGSPWVEKNLGEQEAIILTWMEAQEKLNKPIQLVPLHFIYDKHPGKEKESLMDIFFGDREHPGYFRKVLLFLRNYKKRALGKIGEPVDFQSLLNQFPNASSGDKTRAILKELQRTYTEETLQVTGPKLKERKILMEEVLERRQLDEALRAIAKKTGKPFEEVQKRAQGNLRKISSDIRFGLIRFWNYFLTWLFNRFYDGLIVDPEGIAEVKRIAKGAPLVLIPSHKSHLDYLIFSYVFYHHDLSLPLVCAGDNLSFWPLGPVFRRSGAYFIRRSFAGDPIYAATLKNYVGHLMHEGFFQEFFIEGTRSRSGKLFPPRTGMLKMMIEAFQEDDEIPDVFFVPASIDYERVLEEGSYLDEVKGAKKEKERFWDLLHLPKFLRQRYGKVYVQFATPLSLKEEIGKQGKAIKAGTEPFEKFSDALAKKIIHRINDVTTLLPSGLAAMALLYPKVKSVNSRDFHAKAETLYRAAQVIGPRNSEALKKNVHHAVQEAADRFVGDGSVQYHQATKEKFYTIPDESRLSLEFYKNRSIHALVDGALAQLCRLRGGGGEGPMAVSLSQQARGLLEREFFFSEKISSKDLPNDPPWLHEILLPTLESYWLTLKVTGELEFRKMEEWLLMRKILEQGNLLLLKEELKYPEALSRFTIQNALAQFAAMGVLHHHGLELGPKGRKVYSPGATQQRREEVEKLLGVLLGRGTRSEPL